MITLRDYRVTVVDRIKSDPEFGKALYNEAVSMLLQNEVEPALDMLHTLVLGTIGFVGLAERVGLDPKSLNRMLSSQGNPRTRNLTGILHALGEAVGALPANPNTAMVS